MKTLITVILFSLFFKTAEVEPAPVRIPVIEEPIVINEADYLDKICLDNNIKIRSNPPIEHLLHLEAMIKKYNLPPRLMYRLVWQESRYRANSLSKKKCWGYMQTLPSTFWEEANKLGLDSSIYSNIEVGCYYMRQLLDRFGSDSLALAAYNSGPDRVHRLKRIPRITETQEYVKIILR